MQELRQRLRALADKRRRWGSPILYHKDPSGSLARKPQAVERLYREEGLSLCRPWPKRSLRTLPYLGH